MVTSVAGFAVVELRRTGVGQGALAGFALGEAVPMKGNFISRAAEWSSGPAGRVRRG